MLIEKWHPVTHDMGLINASPGEVLHELLAWHSSIHPSRNRLREG